MMKILYLLLLISWSMAACNTHTEKDLEIQGHRGARGLAPENSIPAFKKALSLGVHVLELDVVISKDKKVVISHEAYLNAAICYDAQGQDIKPESERQYNLYKMDYDQIRKFDCGSKGNIGFPEQQKQRVSKPLLRDMIEEIEAFAVSNQLPVPKYNIEIKSEPEGDRVFHPVPSEFSDLVFGVIHDLLPPERVSIQSFDKRVLQYWRETYPEYQLAFLLEEAHDPQEMQEVLGFLPEIYSPDYHTLAEELVKEYQKLNVRVIPWTINEIEDMKKIKSWNVDGIITDYPDRAFLLSK